MKQVSYCGRNNRSLLESTLLVFVLFCSEDGNEIGDYTVIAVRNNLCDALRKCVNSSTFVSRIFQYLNVYAVDSYQSLDH